MRLNLIITNNNNTIPYDYQHLLVSKFHSWLGANEIHDEISLYSFSWLFGGKGNKNGLEFKNGAKWFISFFEINHLKLVLESILNEPDLFNGMRIKDVILQETPNMDNIDKFYLASPIFIKRYINNVEKYFTYENDISNHYLKETLLNKAAKANIPLKDFSIEFDISYEKRKTKLINYKGIQKIANYCPIIIKGDSAAKEFAWNVGLGNSTGIGFGSLI